MSDSSIWPINRTLSGATTSGQSAPGSDVTERVLCIPQSSSITRPGYALGGGYLSPDMQSVYSTAPADWASLKIINVR